MEDRIFSRRPFTIAVVASIPTSTNTGYFVGVTFLTLSKCFEDVVFE